MVDDAWNASTPRLYGSALWDATYVQPHVRAAAWHADASYVTAHVISTFY